MKTLEELLKEQIKQMNNLKKGECYCDMAIDNPMVKCHSESCESATLHLDFLESELRRIEEGE